QYLSGLQGPGPQGHVHGHSHHVTAGRVCRGRHHSHDGRPGLVGAALCGHAHLGHSHAGRRQGAGRTLAGNQNPAQQSQSALLARLQLCPAWLSPPPPVAISHQVKDVSMTAAASLAVDERRIARYLPYSHHVTDQIIACDNHEYMTVIKVTGRAPDAYAQDELKDWIEALHNVLRGLPMGAFGLYSHIVRRRVTEYPDSTFEQPFAAQFDAAYRATFDTSGLMVNDLYLTVLVHPVQDPILGTFASLEKADAKRLALWQAESIERLNGIVRALMAGLYRYDPETLGIVDRNGFAFSEAAEFLGFLLSGRPQQVPISRERLRDTLPQARPIFGRHGELGELRTVANVRIFGMMELRDYPEATKPGHMNRLLALPHEFVLTQSWGSHTGAAAKKL